MERGVATSNVLALDCGREIFDNAVEIIDQSFGKGYAMRNPILLSAVVKSQTEIYLTVET